MIDWADDPVLQTLKGSGLRCALHVWFVPGVAPKVACTITAPGLGGRCLTGRGSNPQEALDRLVAEMRTACSLADDDDTAGV